MTKKSSKKNKFLLSEETIELIKKRQPVICTGNGKGGVGKSTYAFHIAAAAVEMGLRTLVIDNDEHLTMAACGTSHPDLPDYAFSCDLFTENGINKPIMEMEQLPGCWFLPRDSRLDEVNSTPIETGIVLFPHSHIRELRKQFDLIIFDSPPGKGNLQQATFLCADTAAMITELSNISINGLVTAITMTETLVDQLVAAGYENNYKVPEFIVVPNKFNSQSTDEKEHLENLRSYGVRMTEPVIVRSPIKFATDHLYPVWKIKNGNARLAGKEMKAGIKLILELAVN